MTAPIELLVAKQIEESEKKFFCIHLFRHNLQVCTLIPFQNVAFNKVNNKQVEQ